MKSWNYGVQSFRLEVKTHRLGMKKLNPNDGQALQRRMKECGVSVSRLAKGIGVDEKTIYNYRRGKTAPTKKRQAEIDHFLSINCKFSNGLATHPHRHLLLTLEQMTAGMNYEVVGLPGMLKSQVLQDLESSLKVEKVRHFFFNDLEDRDDIDDFWNSVGNKLIGDNNHRHTLEDVRTVSSDCRLLLDNADMFLKNVERKCVKNRIDFATVGSRWIKNVQNLPCSVVVTSTIATGDFVSLAAAGSPHFFNELDVSQWCEDREWTFWTESLLNGDDRDAIRELRDSSQKIPLVFVSGLKALRAHGREGMKQMVASIHRKIAISIWRRLPVRKQLELKDRNFAFSSNSSITKILAKSGVLTESAARFSIRVPGWLQTWKEYVAE